MAFVSRSAVLAALVVAPVLGMAAHAAQGSTSNGLFPLTRMIQEGPASQALAVKGDARSCISTRDTTWMMLDEDTMLFQHNGELYSNALTQSCASAANSGEQRVVLDRALICSGEALNLPPRDGGSGMAVCRLGAFTPVEIVDGAAGE